MDVTRHKVSDGDMIAAGTSWLMTKLAVRPPHFIVVEVPSVWQKGHLTDFGGWPAEGLPASAAAEGRWQEFECVCRALTEYLPC